MPRGRPAKQPKPDEVLLESVIAEKLGLDLTDPDFADIRRYRIRRAERRELSRSQREAWAIDAYRAYVELLVNPPGATEPVRFVPHIDIPQVIDEYPIRRRRLLMAAEVARWSYRHRVLKETYRVIAESLVPQRRDLQRQRALDAPFHGAMQGHDERAQVYEEARRSLTAPYRLDIEPHSAESIRKAVAAERPIWEAAEISFPAR